MRGARGCRQRTRARGGACSRTQSGPCVQRCRPHATQVGRRRLRYLQRAGGGLSRQCCATWTTSARLDLEASLTGEDTGSVPPDGESYTLLVVDHDSERVLVDEERKADYEAS